MLKNLRNVAAISVCSLSLVLAACSSDDDSTPAAENNLPNGPATDSQTSGPSPTNDLVPKTGDSAIGTVYTAGENNLTLYTLISTEPGEFNCDAACEAIWPPLLTDETRTGISGQFDVLTRADNANQWALLDYPLYYYSGDAAAGDVSGEGLGDVWFVARPIPVDSADNGGVEISVVSGTTLDSSGVRVDKNGFSLYFFANDTDGVSNCNDNCATVWPPLFADKGARGYDRYSIITRDDGSQQWAYDGKALYLYDGDNAAGDTNGDGVNGTWTLAQP